MNHSFHFQNACFKTRLLLFWYTIVDWSNNQFNFQPTYTYRKKTTATRRSRKRFAKTANTWSSRTTRSCQVAKRTPVRTEEFLSTRNASYSESTVSGKIREGSMASTRSRWKSCVFRCQRPRPRRQRLF